MKLLALILTGALTASGLVVNLQGPTVDEAKQYSVDTAHSSVIFGVTHMNSSRFYGRFNKVTGSFSFDESNPSNSKFDIEVDADTVDSGVKDRDNHLKSPDFFNTKQFPTITFKSTSLEKKGDQWKLKGNLTLHGVTKEIESDFEWIGTGEFRGQKKGGFETTFKIKRSDYGMNFMVGPLADEVKVIVSLEGDQK